MNYRLIQYKEDIYRSFWVLPLLMTIAAIILAILALYFDHQFSFDLKKYLQTFISVSNSREVLAIIAASVITITSVTFSIIVLTLSIASNQLGPRILPNFMRQKSTQFVLGFFIGTFIYCLLVIQMIPTGEAYNLPYLSVSLGLILGLVSFFLLIYIIHFVCHVIEINNVLSFLTSDMIFCIKRLYPEKTDKKDIDKIISNKESDLSFLKEKKSIKVLSNDFGYIQLINHKKLYKIAEKNDLVIHVMKDPGKYILKDTEIITIYSDNLIDKKIKNKCLDAFCLGSRRTTTQDIEFAFEELSEIALRALSPGINNPYTAIHCLDRVAQGISVLAERSPLPRIISNEKGMIRLIKEITSHVDIVQTAFNRFRQQARFDISVAIYIIITLKELLMTLKNQQLQRALFQQAELTYIDASSADINDKDKEDLDYFYQEMKNSTKQAASNPDSSG